MTITSKDTLARVVRVKVEAVSDDPLALSNEMLECAQAIAERKGWTEFQVSGEVIERSLGEEITNRASVGLFSFTYKGRLTVEYDLDCFNDRVDVQGEGEN
jgi:hypothetical protein